MRRVVTILLAASLVAPVSAKDIFVNNRFGDDTRSGISPLSSGAGNGPVRTLAKALVLARKGDRIVLENTGYPYHESVMLQAGKHSGMDGYPFTIDGQGATLDGTESVPPAAWRHFDGDVHRFQPARPGPNALYIEDKPVKRRSTADGFPQLQPLEWCVYQGWIYFCTEPDRLPFQYDLRYGALFAGISLYEVRNVKLVNLTIRGFQYDGINAHDNAFQVQIEHVISEGNGRSGFSVGGASRVTLTGCQATGNGIAQLRTEGACEVRLSKCELAEDTAPAIVRDGGRVIRNEMPTP